MQSAAEFITDQHTAMTDNAQIHRQKLHQNLIAQGFDIHRNFRHDSIPFHRQIAKACFTRISFRMMNQMEREPAFVKELIDFHDSMFFDVLFNSERLILSEGHHQPRFHIDILRCTQKIKPLLQNLMSAEPSIKPQIAQEKPFVRNPVKDFLFRDF